MTDRGKIDESSDDEAPTAVDDMPSAMAVDSEDDQESRGGASVEACMAAFFQPEPVQWDCECAPEVPASSTTQRQGERSALRSASVCGAFCDGGGDTRQFIVLCMKMMMCTSCDYLHTCEHKLN